MNIPPSLPALSVDDQIDGDRARRLEVMGSYYDAIAAADGMFTFLSPLQLPQWIEVAATWASQASFAAEIGIGLGELAERLLVKPERLGEYSAIDISTGMLEHLRQRLDSIQTSVIVKFHQLDISDNAAHMLGYSYFDRVISVNVFQDLDAAKALANVLQILRPGGLFRATIIRRETQDQFWVEDDSYDACSGRLFTTSIMHDQLGMRPLGLRHNDREGMAYYRIQQFYTEAETRDLFEAAGFTIVSMSVIEYPVEVVQQRWSSSLHRISLSSRQESLLKKWRCYPDAYDVIAMKPST